MRGFGRRLESRFGEPMTSDASNVYRLSIPPSLHQGEYEACPACGVSFIAEQTVCKFCGNSEFETATHYPNAPLSGQSIKVKICGKATCPGRTTINPFKQIQTSSSPGKYCAPTQRRVLKKGYWIWSRDLLCEESGTHLHQNCARCGWKGIVLPVSKEVLP